MPPAQSTLALFSDDWMDKDQYASVYNLYPELQSCSHDAALGWGITRYRIHDLPGGIADPIPSSDQLFGALYPSLNTLAGNNVVFPPPKVNDLFQHGQFPTLTNVNDQFNSNVYEPLQPSFVLPSFYALGETDLPASCAGVDQPGNTFSPTYDVFTPASQSYVPFLSQPTSVALTFDSTAEVSIALPHPTSMANEIPPNLHGPIHSPEPNTCQECTQPFPSNGELERHAKSLHHNAFKCKCGKPYARLDNLKRHWNQTPKFPCPHCNRYTGANAFAREDHLTQHLRTYHRINNSEDENNTTEQFFCTWPNCIQQQRSFGIKSQYTNHMRRIHNYSPFPCLVEGCVKTAGKGYYRERDLLKHSQEVHAIGD